MTFCQKSYQTHTYGDIILKGFSRVFSLIIKEIHIYFGSLETVIH